MNMKILLELLEEIRSQQGYISEEAMIQLANEFDMPKAELFGIISFYSRFHTEPQGKHIIRVCKSVVCAMNSSKSILEAIENHLKIQPGMTTENKLFTLELMECLGQCNISPAISIDDVVYGNLTPESVVNVLQEYENSKEV